MTGCVHRDQEQKEMEHQGQPLGWESLAMRLTERMHREVGRAAHEDDLGCALREDIWESSWGGCGRVWLGCVPRATAGLSRLGCVSYSCPCLLADCEQVLKPVFRLRVCGGGVQEVLSIPAVEGLRLFSGNPLGKRSCFSTNGPWATVSSTGM